MNKFSPIFHYNIGSLKLDPHIHTPEVNTRRLQDWDYAGPKDPYTNGFQDGYDAGFATGKVTGYGYGTEAGRQDVIDASHHAYISGALSGSGVTASGVGGALLGHTLVQHGIASRAFAAAAAAAEPTVMATVIGTPTIATLGAPAAATLVTEAPVLALSALAFPGFLLGAGFVLMGVGAWHSSHSVFSH